MKTLIFILLLFTQITRAQTASYGGESNAVQLQGWPISPVKPVNGQILVFNGTSMFWVPMNGGGAGLGTVTSVGSGTGLLGGPITTSGTLSVNVGTGANQIVQFTSSDQYPAGDGFLITNLNAANITGGTNATKLQGVAIATTSPTSAQVLTYNATLSEWLPQSTGPSGVTLVASGRGLLGGPITSVGTLSVDVGTGANQIVQLTVNDQLPAVDAFLLTNLNVASGANRALSNLTATAINVSLAPGIGSDFDLGQPGFLWENLWVNRIQDRSSSTGLLGQVLYANGDGSFSWSFNGQYLTNINASFIKGVAVASTSPTSGQILFFNSSLNEYFPQSVASSQWLNNGTSIYYNLGYVGIGTSSPISYLDVSPILPPTITALGQIINSNATIVQTNNLNSSGVFYYGINQDLTLDVSSSATDLSSLTLNGVGGKINYNANAPLSQIFAGNFFAQTNTTADVDNVLGTSSYAFPGGSGNINNSFGIDSEVFMNSSATMTNAYGVYGKVNTFNGPITNAYGLYSAVGDYGGTYGSSYGLYIGTVSGTAAWGIYENSSTNNYLSSNTGIGTTTPQGTLDVEGTGTIVGHICLNGTCVSSLGGGGSSQWTTVGSNIYYNLGNSNGNFVGIGTATPLGLLDVEGTGTVFLDTGYVDVGPILMLLNAYGNSATMGNPGTFVGNNSDVDQSHKLIQFGSTDSASSSNFTSNVNLISGSLTGTSPSGSSGNILIGSGGSFDSGATGQTGSINISTGYMGGSAGGATSGNISISSGTATGGAAGNITLSSGSSSSNTAGNISLQPGSGTGGIYGKIQFITGVGSTSGQAWTAKDTSGSGYWQSLQGTLCGWYDSVGMTLVTSCLGSNPNTSCPSGYTQKTITGAVFCAHN